jgi:hypothetical protein
MTPIDWNTPGAPVLDPRQFPQKHCTEFNLRNL